MEVGHSQTPPESKASPEKSAKEMEQVRAIRFKIIRYFNGIVNWPKEEIKANDLKKRERLRRAFHTQVQYTEAA